MSRRAVLVVLGIAAAVAATAVSPETRAGASATDTDAARVELGRRLFFDPAVGRQGRIGCAACHDPEHGFSDPRVKSVDETGELPRHSQPLTDLAGEGFHWDGEFDTVREIVEARVLPRDEVAARGVARAVARAESVRAAGETWDREALSNRASGAGLVAYYGDARGVVRDVGAAAGESPADARLARTGFYARGFEQAFGDANPTLTRVVLAIDAYLRTVKTTTSAFDRFQAGDRAALSPSATRGLELFEGKASCAECHLTKSPLGGRATLSDGKFHDTGVAWDERSARMLDFGRRAASLRQSDIGRFKTPSLRDVARRAPYMHDGRFATLTDVVRYYDRGGTPHPGLDPKIGAIGLSDAQVADLVAFLESLSGDERAGLADAKPWRDPSLRVVVRDVSGAPVPGVVVSIRAAGDRLRGAEPEPEPVLATTGDDGVATLARPRFTHVSVHCGGPWRFERLPLVPDYADRIEVLATAVDDVLLAVPTGLCESATTLRILPVKPHPFHPPLTLRLLRRMEDGRSVFGADNLIAPGAKYELRTGDDPGLIGIYVPRNWVVGTDVFDKAPPKKPSSVELDPRVAERLTALLGR